MKNTFWNDFGSSGELYQMGSQPQREEIVEILDAYDCNSVLDVGCGTGPLWQLLRERKTHPRYKGVDYSETFINTCKNNFPDAEWDVADAREIWEEDASFDGVVLLHSLDHIDNYNSVLYEAGRIARKIVVICLWRPFVETPTKTNSVNKDYEDTHLTEFNKKHLDTVIEQNMLEILDQYVVDSEKYNYIYVLGVK